MRWLWGGGLAAILLIGLDASAVAADDAASRGKALLAQAKAASGGAAWDTLGGWSERGSAVAGGATGSYDTLVDLHAYGMANHHVLAGSARSHGFDGSTAWMVDSAGAVRIDASPQGLAAARQGAFVSAWGFFFPDRFPAQSDFIGDATADGADFDIVRVTPADGLPIELWIDRKTHLVTRMVDRSGPKTVIAVLSEFRSTHGVLAPFDVAESDGDPNHTLELRTETIEFSPPDRSRFAPPR
jgi:hypothetical protein